MAYPPWVMGHYTMLYKCGKHTHDFLGHFIFHFSPVFYILGVFLVKTIIPLWLVGNEMIVPNLVLCALLVISTISYPTRACGIIVKYNSHKHRFGE